jgi:hypothetical protein
MALPGCGWKLHSTVPFVLASIQYNVPCRVATYSLFP